MIGNGTFLTVSDNSGAKVAQCINQSGKSWGIGDIITVAIKRAQPRSKVAAGTVSLFGVGCGGWWGGDGFLFAVRRLPAGGGGR